MSKAVNNINKEWVIVHFQPSQTYTIAEGVVGYYKLYQEYKFYYKEDGKQKAYLGTVVYIGDFNSSSYIYYLFHIIKHLFLKQAQKMIVRTMPKKLWRNVLSLNPANLLKIQKKFLNQMNHIV